MGHTGSMGHDTHFLGRLTRLDDHRLLDLALGLYRNPRAVGLLLARNALTDDAERVALALDDSPRPPHVIVARDGGFVTCLGPGMSVGGCLVIGRARIDETLATSGALDRADAHMAAKGDINTLLTAVGYRGRRVAREDFDAVYAFGPALHEHFDRVLAESARVQELVIRGLLPRHIDRYDPKVLAMLRSYSTVTPVVDQFILLSIPFASFMLEVGEVGYAGALHQVLAVGSELTTAARVATFAAHMGPATIDAYIERWRALTELQLAIEPFVGLLAIATAHPEARGRIIAALEEMPSGAPELATALRTARRALDEPAAVEARLRDRERQALAREGVAEADDALVDAAIGARNASLFEPTVMRTRLPEVVVWAARRKPNDYCLPAAALEALPERVLPARISVGAVRKRLDALHAHYRARVMLDRPSLEDRLLEPLTDAAKPGRNAPCPCGSGLKYKRCCLRKGG